MVVARTPGSLVPAPSTLRQDWTANGVHSFEAGYKTNGINGKGSKRQKLKERLNASKRNSGEESWTSSLVQDREGHLHDPEYMEQAASRTSFSSHRVRQRTTSHLSRSRASSISSSSSSASEKDLPNAKYANPPPKLQLNAMAMPGLPPGVTTGGLGVSVSGGAAKASYDSVAEEATPRLKLTSGLYPSSHHGKNSTLSKPRSVSDNVSNRMNGTSTYQPSSMRATSLAPSSTSFQSIPATSAISPAYNPYQYIPTTSTRQPYSYRAPPRHVTPANTRSSLGAVRPAINRTRSDDSAVSDPNIIDMSGSSSQLRSSSFLPLHTQTSNPNMSMAASSKGVPSITLSHPMNGDSTIEEEEEPPIVRQIQSDYLPSLDNPERHKNSNHKGGFGSAIGKLEVDMRFALFRGTILVKQCSFD